MSDPEESPRDPMGERLDELRDEAERTGTVDEAGAAVAGGPIPDAARAGGGEAGEPPHRVLGDEAPGDEETPGYYGRPVIKAPVWTWEVPLYFFVGGLAGGGAVLALAAMLAGGDLGLVRAALWLAVAGAVLSPLLLILDLGRPARFLGMLRVFKWRSPMSVGAWTLVAFGALALPAALLAQRLPTEAPISTPLAGLIGGAAVVGAVLSTYTGVLVGATVVPAWLTHRRLLPLHFGLAGLGSAAASLELIGFRTAPLFWIGVAVAALETLVGAAVEFRARGAADRALRRGRAGLMLRTAGILSGPLPLLLRLLSLGAWAAAAAPILIAGAAISFLLGSLLSRYGWVAAGRASARDPEATLAAEVGSGPAS